jgi:uncharacterized iron-regulated membrane protein
MTTSELSGKATPDSRTVTRPASRTAPLTGLLLRLHFYAGILVAPFLVIAALSGLAYTLTPQLDQIIYGDRLTVAGSTARPVPLAEQVAAARAAHPEGTITAVRPGTGGSTTRVVFSLPELGEKQHTVYIDPHTARSTGQLTTFSGATPVTTWLDDLHRHLHLGDLGRHYSELAASWLWVLVLGGLLLWWRRRGTTRPRTGRLLLPDLLIGKGVRRTRSWHATTGVWLAVGLLFLSATGLTWSRYAGANVDAGLAALKAETPAISTALTGAPAGDGGAHHHGGGQSTTAGDPTAFDRVLTVARGAGLSGPVEIVPADGPHTAWVVTQIDNTWPVAKDRVAVDPDAAVVTARSDFADWPLLAQLSSLGVEAHMGVLFGVVNRLLLAALALGLLCVVVWGYRMWWQRRPTRADRRGRLGTPPARGGLRGLPPWGLVIGVVLTVAVGWALPLFGVSLLAFLVIDAVLGLAARRRRRSVAAPTDTVVE